MSRIRRRILRWVGLLLVAVLAAGGLVAAVDRFAPFRPFTREVHQPTLLVSVRNLARYEAAVGDYQLVLDVQRGRDRIPLAIAGQRTLFVAAGTVSAYVDFADLPGEAMTVSTQRRTVQLRLPPPVLDKPNLDPERSYVFDQKRGLLDRLGSVFGSPPSQQEFYVLAEKRLTEAARASGLLERAAANARSMLTRLLASLGFRVTFSAA